MKYANRAFIFDMDGTLVDNMRHHTEAWRTLIEENGYEFDERKFLVETAGQTGDHPRRFRGDVERKAFRIGA